MIDWSEEETDELFQRNLPKYSKMRRHGSSLEEVAREMVGDQRDELLAAEIVVDGGDRARIERTAAFGAKELGLDPPRIRFFDGSKFDFGGIHFRYWPNEIWVDGTRTLREQKRLALHESAHVQHTATGLGAGLEREDRHELLERDADRFARRGQHW